MSWSGGSYTKGNSATGGWAGDASLGIGIEAGRHDTQDNDFQDGINNCIAKDGQNSMIADLNLGGYKPVNLAAGTAGAPAICAGNDVNTGIFSPAADNIGIATNGVERVRIDNSGNVGIGTTTPGENLHIKSATPRIRFEDTDGGGAYSSISGNSPSGSISIQADITNVSANSAIGFDVDGAQKMNLDGSGRLAINTTQTAGYNLTVGGSVITQGTTNGDLTNYISNSNSGTNARATVLFGNNAAAYGSINLNSSTYSGTGDANDLTIINSATDGSVRIYTAPSGGGSVVYRFGVDPDGVKGFSNGAINISSTAISSGAGTHFVKWSSSTGTLTYDTSSIRYKENIEAIPYGLAETLQFSPKKFAYKSDGSIGIGFIAEEVQPIVPEVISLNSDGQPDAISYDRLTAVLCKAIQELNAKVEALESRVAELEA